MVRWSFYSLHVPPRNEFVTVTKKRSSLLILYFCNVVGVSRVSGSNQEPLLNAPESNPKRFRIINLPVRKSAGLSAAIQHGSPVLHAADFAFCLTNNNTIQGDDALSAYCRPTESERTA